MKALLILTILLYSIAFTRSPQLTVVPEHIDFNVTSPQCMYVGRVLEDGFGSQMQYQLATLVHAERNNIPACLSVSRSMEHVNVSEKDALFQLTGLPFYSVNECERCSYTSDFSIFQKDGLPLTIESFLHKSANIRPHDRRKTAIIHMRVRNPVDNRDQGVYLPLLKRILEDIQHRYGKDVVFHVYSQIYSRPYMELLEWFDLHIHLRTSTLETFQTFIHADILVMAPSALSYIAAIYNPNTVYYVPYNMPPLSRFIQLK